MEVVEKKAGEKTVIREQILNFESKLAGTDGAFFGDNELCPLKHSFSDGIYVREIFIPKGTVLTGKIHKHAHPNFLLEGEVDVVTESGGRERFKAPMSMISPAGTKRVVHAITDVKWATVHHNPENSRDLEKLESIVIANNYLEYENFIKGIEVEKAVKCLNEGDEIKNCGLNALKNMCGLKSVSARTLINMAEDNGLVLHPYKVPSEELKSIPFPAIVHSQNHFDYISKAEDLKAGVKYSGNVLLAHKADLTEIANEALKNIIGSTWVAVAGGVASITSAGIGAHRKKKDAQGQKEAMKADLIKTISEQKRSEIESKSKEKRLTAIIVASFIFLLIIAITFVYIKQKKTAKA